MQGIKSIADKNKAWFCCFKYTQYLVILNLIIFEICYKNNNSSNINLQ